MSFGIGDLLVPTVFTHLFDGVKNPDKGLSGFLDAIEIVLSTPCQSWFRFCLLSCRLIHLIVLIAGIVAALLNLILPQESLPEDEDDDDVHQIVEEVESGSHTKEHSWH